MQLVGLFSAFILGFIVNATPLSLSKVGDMVTVTFSKTSFSTTQGDVLNAALENHGLQSLINTTTANTARTSPVPATSLEKRQIDPVIVLCPAIDCSGACQAFTLIGDQLNVCFVQSSPEPFYSLFVNNPSEVELLFQVGAAANTICNGMLILPETNVCFNINPFGESWELFNTGGTF